MSRYLVKKSKEWVERLLPVCEYNRPLAQRELEWMKERVLGDGGSWSSPQQQQLLETMIHDRTVHHKPLQYILGTQPFCELDIVTRPPILIPRWETEEWTYKIIHILQPLLSTHTPFRILDACTGSGCIGLSLAAHLPKNTVEVTGLDISHDAIKLAEENLYVHKDKIHNPIRFYQQDLFDYECDKRFNLVVSNPPYISHDEYKHIDAGVKDWEDPQALVTDDDGRRIHNRLIQMAKHCQPVFKNVPRIIMEIGGTHQVEHLKQELMVHDYHFVEVWKDLADKDRVIVAS